MQTSKSCRFHGLQESDDIRVIFTPSVKPIIIRSIPFLRTFQFAIETVPMMVGLVMAICRLLHVGRSSSHDLLFVYKENM